MSAFRPDVGAVSRWFALFVVGQAAVLTMIDAGPLPRYQHLPPISALLSSHPWALALVAMQSAVVASAFARRLRKRSARSLFGGLPIARVAAAVLISSSIAATVSPSPLRYVSELIFAAYLQMLALSTVALLASAAPARLADTAGGWVDRVLGTAPTGGDPGDRAPVGAFAWAIGGLTTVVAIVLCIVVYQRHPHIPDEVGYLHHAKYFAAGMLTMPAPPVPEAFDVDLMEYEPARWYCPMSPGWPVVLALGSLVKMPWLVNPLLAGINVVLTCAVLSRLFSRRVARIATILLAASPWFLFLAMSFMTHQLALTCVLLAVLGVQLARSTGRLHWSLVAGAAIGASSLIRPLDGAIVGGTIGLWALGFGGSRLKMPQLAGLAAATVVVGGLILPYNRVLTGSAWSMPVNNYFEKHYGPDSNAFGFGPGRGVGWAIDPNPGHSPVDGLINANLNAFGLNTDLLGWGTGSLILAVWLLCSGRLRRQDWLMIAFTGVFTGAYFLYWFSGGPDFGARYWFPIILPLIALSARGADRLARSLGSGVWIAIGALTLMTLLAYVPWRSADKYYEYRGMQPGIRELAAREGFRGDLVLVAGKRFPDYASAFAQNPVDLTGPDTVYAWDRDLATRVRVLKAYPGRRVWLVEGPSLTGVGFRVISGPVSASSLLRVPSPE